MNIEKTISEHAVADILTPMLESQDRIVTEDVAPLFDQATGLDTPSASGTVTTTIEESRSVITAIIRKAWTATLTMLGGASVIGYITAAYTYLRNRLQGNETYGIPDRRSEISASSPLAANLALLNDRKISGVPEAEDGMSLVHLLNDLSGITELTDDNVGWTMVRNNLGMFTGLKHLQLGCDVIDATPASYSNFIGTSNYEDLDLSKVKKVYIRNNSGCVSAPNAVVDLSGIEEFYGYTNYHSKGYALISACANESLDLSKLHKIESTGSAVGGSMAVPIVANSSALKNIDLSSMAAFNTGQQSANANKTYYFRNCPNVESIKVGKLTSFNSINFMCYGDDNTTMQKLVHFEIGAGTAISLNLAYWNPTYALQNQLSQFLSNFKTYIALRLKGGYPIGQGPILTLSQAVHNAITAAEDDYHIREIITKKGWTISPAPN